MSRPGTSASLSKSIIQGALQQRRQRRAEQFPLPAVRSSAGGGNSGSGASRPVSGGGGITSRSSTSSGGGVTSRSLAGGAGSAAGAASTARPSTAAGGSAVELVLPPAPGDAAAAAVAAQQAVLLAQWGPAARQGLAAGGEQAVSGTLLTACLLDDICSVWLNRAVCCCLQRSRVWHVLRYACVLGIISGSRQRQGLGDGPDGLQPCWKYQKPSFAPTLAMCLRGSCA